MSTLRPLSEMLIGIAEGVFAVPPGAGLRVTRVETALPVDIGVRGRGENAELLGELPRFITRTAFDPPPSRLTIVWEERLS